MAALVQNLEDLEGKEVSLNLLSRLVLSSSECAAKYVEAGGLAPALLQRCAYSLPATASNKAEKGRFSFFC